MVQTIRRIMEGLEEPQISRVAPEPFKHQVLSTNCSPITRISILGRREYVLLLPAQWPPPKALR